MFGLLRSNSDRLIIDRGCVPCPIRGDVDSDLCLACRWLVEIDEQGAVPFVRCKPRRLPAANDRFVGPA